MDRLLFALGAASALISVGAGAFGAHVLRARLSPELLAVFETGARYGPVPWFTRSNHPSNSWWVERLSRSW